MKNYKIVCGKFDSDIYFNQNYLDNHKIRIGSSNPNKLKPKIYELIATDGQRILYKNKLYEVRNFLINTNRSILKNLIVLTIKERDLILEALVDFDLDINIFEIKYPVFKHIKYISNINKNYEELKKLTIIVSNLNIKGKSLANNLSTEYLYKIERKLRYKNKLDSFFAFAYKGGYQEVFKLKEERKDRVVIAMDFNSMYVDCMMGKFVEPKSIKYINLKDKVVDLNQLDYGLYRVVLKNPKNTFFRDFHPFKYTNLNKSYYFKIEDNQDIEILLFKNEINYYKKFFNCIEILEGFISEKYITHPLKQYAQNIYSDRLKYKSDNDNLMESLSKYKLITIHSSTNAKRFKTLFFKTAKSIIKYISAKFMINFPKYMNDIEKLESIYDNNYFTFWAYKNGFKIKIINFDTYESIYSISSQIIANGRMKMIQTIEKFLSYNSVEICYSNIDSLHISIKKNEVNNFLEKHRNIISNKLGDLKIESISENGYWFDIGRYWLKSNGKVDIFTNKTFNQNNTSNKFIKYRKVNIICKNNTFSYLKTVWFNIYNNLTYHKKIYSKVEDIDKIDYIRYNFNEVENLNVAKNSFNKEVFNSKKLKIELLNKIATV